MGNPANLNFGAAGPFSLEAWFNWNGRGAGDVGTGGVAGSYHDNIIRKSNYPVSGSGSGYRLRIETALASGLNEDNLEFAIGDTVGTSEPNGKIYTPISAKSWHHVVATRDSSGAMKLYVDGELKGTKQATNAETTSAAPFTLGAWDDRFGVTENFAGMIDEVSVYNRALEASEVKAIFSADSDGKCAS